MRALVLLAFFTVGLASRGSAQSTVVDSITFGGVMHTFRVYVPANYSLDGARALILHLHGYSSSGAIEQAYTNYMPIADTAGFLVAYPDGLTDSAGRRYWNVGILGVPNTNDVGYISVLLDTLIRRYSIDRNRIYASGLSLGGFMAYQLACLLGNRITAVASVSGSMAPSVIDTIRPRRAVPMMEIHGTADKVVLYKGDFGAVAVDTLMKYWVTQDGCDPRPSGVEMPNLGVADSCNVSHQIYFAGTDGARCELYEIFGGTHVDWPSTSSHSVGVDADFDASREIWLFFSRFRLDQFHVIVDDRPAEVPTIELYPNPCDAVISAPRVAGGRYAVFDLLGRERRSSISNVIDVGDLAPGCYLLSCRSGATRGVSAFIKR
jgi:polyhydroxybutyrate depolymerase